MEELLQDAINVNEALMHVNRDMFFLLERVVNRLTAKEVEGVGTLTAEYMDIQREFADVIGQHNRTWNAAQPCENCTKNVA